MTFGGFAGDPGVFSLVLLAVSSRFDVSKGSFLRSH